MSRLNVRVLSVAALVMLLVGGTLMTVYSINRSAGDSNTPANIPMVAGSMAAPFTLDNLQGQQVSLSSLRGKVVFLNIWATWCGPCRAEMPSIQTLYDEFKNRSDFVILAVSQDDGSAKKVANFVHKNGYHFEVLLDPHNQVGAEYGVSGYPETFIIDRKGRIVAHHLGAFDWSRNDVRESLQELLDTKAISKKEG